MSGDTPRAIVFMVASMAFFAIEDFFIKRVGESLALGQMLTLLSAGVLAIFTVSCLLRGDPIVSRQLLRPLVATRSACEAGATVCLVSALALIPLTLTSAIIQVQPILITIGAALWLGEAVGWRRWGAVTAGLIGVLLILRPGLEGFSPAALIAVGTAVFLAIRDLASRRITDDVTNWQLGTWAFACLLLSALAILAWQRSWAPMSLPVTRDLVIAILAFFAAYLCIMSATRVGEVSAVIPFRYTRLVFALILGMVFLGERPDAPTLIGAGIVIASGLYSWMREQARA